MGTLSIVATPIGNLEDVTLRALRTLKEADVIYAEDTRVISKLLARYEIQKPLQRLDAATEREKAEEIAARLEGGERVVYVSDAGTPGISDPGARLVAYVRENLPETKIEAIPGASSLTAALSIAGVSGDAFTFIGFLPHKKGRQTALKGIAASEHVVVLFESPHRIVKLMGELDGVLGESGQVTLLRELTKMHEEVLVGRPKELEIKLETEGKARGEFVVVVRP